MVLSPLRAGPAPRPGGDGEVRSGGGGGGGVLLACFCFFLVFVPVFTSFLPRFVADVAQ